MFGSIFVENFQNFAAGFNLAIIYNRLRKFKDAFEIHKYLDNAFAPDFDNLVSLGNLYAQNRQFREALLSYHRAKKLSPNNAYIYYNIGITEEQVREPKRALAFYNRALSRQPNYFDAALRKAQLLERLKKRTAALNTYLRLLKEPATPQQKAELEYQKSCLLARMGRYRQALISFRCIKRRSLNQKMLLALGGNVRDLEKRCRTVRKASPLKGRKGVSH
jgi:tetratricopeptide (TPR) repeat protein